MTALHHNKAGLSIIGAAVFIIGEMAGSGILALPNAVAQAGKLKNCFGFRYAKDIILSEDSLQI